MENNFSCQYYTEDSLCELLKTTRPSFTMLNLNIRSLDKNFSSLVALLHMLDYDIDIITLTEIGRKNISNRINLLKNEYECEFIMPKTKKCGGACIFIRKNMQYHVRNDLSLACVDAEDVWVEAEVGDKKVIIGSVYRHPGTNLKNFKNCLDKTLHKIDNVTCNSFVCGDFNVDGMKMNTDSKISEFYECLMTLNFIPTIILPTRITDTTMTLIDNIFMKFDRRNVNDMVVSGNIYSDISDHLPNFVMVNDGNHRSSKCSRPNVRLFGEKNLSKFVDGFTSVNWNDFFLSSDVNHMLSLFYEKFKSNFEDSFPITRLSRKRSKDKPWITANLKKDIAKKSELYRRFLNHPSTENKERYTAFKNILTVSLRKAEAKFYLDKIDEKKKNVRALWQIFGPIINPNKTKQSVKLDKLEYNNRKLTKAKDIANTMNDFFVDIGPKLSRKFTKDFVFKRYLKSNQKNSLYMYPTNSLEIMELISKLGNKKAPGDDEISGKILKACPSVFSELISHLANEVMTSGKYPDKLKIGKVVPIYKKGNRLDPTNYRPINLLSTINKLIEKVLYKRFYEYFEKFGMIYKYQFGFRHSYSTTMALIEITDQLREQIEKKNITMGIFIDLTKAFDLVNHDILIFKLQTYGIRGPAIELIKSYLSERTQYTKIGSTKSDINTIKCGVPQGSVLGPLFFLIFINDMQHCTKSKLRLFADDTNIFISDKDANKVKQLAETCLSDITNWLTVNKLLLSEEKTNFSIFLPAQKTIPEILNRIKVNGKTVQRTESCKYLGVILDDKLCFDKHIIQLSKDLVKIISAFKIVRDWVPRTEKMKLYYAYFHSKLQYGLEIYGSSANKFIRKLEVLQHKALKALFKLDSLTPSRKLYSEFKVLSVTDLYSFKIAKFVHNQLNDDRNNVFSDYFSTIADYNDNDEYPNTRNRENIHINKTRTVKGGKMVKIVGGKVWNLLIDKTEEDLRHKSTFQFNKIIKNYYLKSYEN